MAAGEREKMNWGQGKGQESALFRSGGLGRLFMLQ